MATDTEERRHADLKHMLEQRRHAVAQGVRVASEDTSLARADVRDAGDEGEAMLQDAIRFALIGMKSEMLVQIDRALERLDEGNYGTCADCAKDIVESRLRALPFAVRCRRCEERREDVERQCLWRARVRTWRSADAPNS